MAEIRIRTPSDELIPGEPSKATITLAVPSPLKVRGLHTTFHGAEETQATYTTYNAATKATETHTAIEHVDIVRKELLLRGNERKGFFGNFTDGVATMLGGGEHEVLEPGEYSFDMDFTVPSNGRPTFAGVKCRVFYELSVQVDVPVARDIKALHSFRVADTTAAELPPPEPVRTRYPEDQDLGRLESWMLPDIRVEAAIARQAYQKGETIDGVFQLETPKPLEYRSILVRLIAVESTAAHGHEDTYTHLGEPVQIAGDGVIESDYAQRFSLPAFSPGLMPVKGSLFAVECFVQIELDVPWAKDPKIRVPVILV